MNGWKWCARMVATLGTLLSASALAQDGMPAQPAAPPVITVTPDFSPGIGAAGMGRAQNATSEGTDGVFNNPAGIASAYMYALEGGLIYTDDATVLSAAVVDSKTNPKVAAGVGFNYYFSRGAGEALSGIDLKVPLAIPIVQDRVSLGLGGRYTRLSAGDVEVLNGFSLEAGAVVRVVDQVRLGLVAKNLIDPCDVSACQGWLPLLIGGGVAYSTTELALAADVEADTSTSQEVAFNVDVGGEYVVANVAPVRLGFRRLGVEESSRLTAGAGWRSQTAGLDLSYEHDLSRGGFGQLFLGVAVYLQ